MSAPDLHDVLRRLGDALTMDGDNLLWRGPRGMLTAAELEVLAKAKPAIIAALRGDDHPVEAAPPPEPIEDGSYSGFLASPPGRKLDVVRGALCLLESLAYRLECRRRDQVLRDAHARRAVKA